LKDGLENIDEVFKQAFDGFEANVDPSVWSNVQSSINSGAGSTPQVDPSTIAGVGKSLALKIVAGAAILGTVATATYFVPDLFKNKETIVAENTVVEGGLIEAVEEDETTVALAVVDKNVKGEVVAEIKESNTAVSNDESVTEVNRTEREEVVVEGLVETSENKTENNNSTSEASNSESTKEAEIKSTVIKENNPSTVKESIKFSVKINVNVISGKAPLTVQFDAYGEGAVVYEWNFDDNTEKEIEVSPVHTFFKEGSYFVKCIGVDDNGNSKEAYKTIIVEKNISSSLMPLQNLITPNGDGQNDFIKIRGENIAKVSVRILDTKGNLVYTMNSMDDKWDGKNMAGNKLVQGQYPMIVVAKGTDGKDLQKKTMINLIP
jgi:gliding motility-associated-like protein